MSTEIKKFTERQEEIANFANALAHPVRVAILDLLASKACCYHGDMADELPIANSTLSQHLKVLKDAGLIQGEITPPKTKYCIHRDNYKKAGEIFSFFFENALETTFSEEGVILCS
ncbi:MAG: helix-turn-helix transcriptional regulator [Saprospiraceae bacterium]|nr:helix-turn-helix transcriptional regulator [Saprospiraceae bacterium]